MPDSAPSRQHFQRPTRNSNLPPPDRGWGAPAFRGRSLLASDSVPGSAGVPPALPTSDLELQRRWRGAPSGDLRDTETHSLEYCLATGGGSSTLRLMSTGGEIESALAKLPVEAQHEVAAWLETRLWPENPAMLAAIDEAERSLADEGGVPVEEVRRDLRSWITV